MKRVVHLLLFLSVSLLLLSQNSETVCKIGFSFQISNNNNWGNNEPVVTEVVPGSPAHEAGLKINDIILEVNGNGTYLKPAHTIMSWFDDEQLFMSLGVRNFESSFKQLQIKKDCRFSNAINEFQLAPVFSFYSLEDVQERIFYIPIKTTSNPDADFFNYRTYDFEPASADTKELDEQINAIFERSLTQMGLKRDKADPDFIIQTFYSYQNNPSYNPNVAAGHSSGSWRFDLRNNKMVKIPVFDPTEPVKNDHVRFDLEFGFRFYDRKFTEPGKSVLVYEGEVKERLSDNYGLLPYLEMNLPLIILKFPYAKTTALGKYRVNLTRFNYTGISYDINDLRTVVAVSPNSPAAAAGILVGDQVSKVQEHSFNHNAKSLTSSYRRFINETMKYRDPKTKYTDSNGYSNAMFWDITHYYNIAKEISDNRKYKSGFSYLFDFNQYVNWESNGKLNFEVQRAGEKLHFEVKPELNRNVQIFVE